MPFAPSHSTVAVIPLPDHVMVLLDDTTYDEVADCEFLRRFCRYQPKTADSSVAGRYATLALAGTSTFLELFRGGVPGPRRYTAGLVFSFESSGAVPRAREVLRDRVGVAAHYQLVERAGPDGVAQPWYHLLAPDLGADSPLLLMLNQVTPEYYQGLGARPGPDGELRRREYLDAMLNASGAPSSAADDRRLTDLVGVTVRVRSARADRLAALFTALGFRPLDGVLHGPDFALALDVDDGAPEGVTEVVMALAAGPGEPAELRFGAGSRLVLDPSGHARWTFTPLP